MSKRVAVLVGVLLGVSAYLALDEQAGTDLRNWVTRLIDHKPDKPPEPRPGPLTPSKRVR